MSSKIEEIIFPDTFIALPRLSLWRSSLKKYKFPKNLNSYGTGSIGSLLNLEYFESENPNYIVYGGVVYNYDFTILIAYPPNCTQTIEHTVTKISGICGYSGLNQPYLKIDLPISYFGDSSIRNCASLECIDLSACIFKSLSALAIADNPNLKKVILPDTYQTFEPITFQLSNIENLYITSDILVANIDTSKGSQINNIFYCGMNTFAMNYNNIVIQNVYVRPNFSYESFFGVKVTKNYTGCSHRRNPLPTPFPKYCHCITDFNNPYYSMCRSFFLYLVILFDN